MRHVELFSGIGGFRQGMRLLTQDGGPQFSCVGYSEIDAAAEKTYLSNFDTSNETVIGDIAAFVEDEQAIARLPRFDLLTGGFPCQSFSMMGEQKGFEDTRGTLYFSMAKLIKKRMPSFLLLENVKNLKTHDNGNTFKRIKQTLEDMGYQVWADIFNTSEFGLAQTRNRVYIFATTRKAPRTFDFSQESVKKSFLQINGGSFARHKNVLDVLHKRVPAKYYLSERIKKTVLNNGTGGYVAKSEIDLNLARPLCATMAKMHRACQDNYFSEGFILSKGKKRYCGGVLECTDVPIRRLLPEEAFALQGFDESFVRNAREMYGVSDSSLYKQAGNAVSVNVVYAILAYLSNAFRWR